MENLLENEKEARAQMWRVWEEKGRQHDKALARKIKWFAGALIGLLVLAGIAFLLPGR